MAEGASTLNARTEREQTNTLPNHTGMVTGRRIAAAKGGHGVTWNDERLRPAHRPGGGRPPRRLGVQRRRLPRAGHRALREQAEVLPLRAVLGRGDRQVRPPRGQRRGSCAGCARTSPTRPGPSASCTCRGPTWSGHERASCPPPTSTPSRPPTPCSGRIVAKVESQGELADHTVLIVTADHGGKGRSHRDPTKLVDYRMPFIVWGAGRRGRRRPLRPQPRLRGPRPGADVVRRRRAAGPQRRGRQPGDRPARAGQGPGQRARRRPGPRRPVTPAGRTAVSRRDAAAADRAPGRPRRTGC